MKISNRDEFSVNSCTSGKQNEFYFHLVANTIYRNLRCSAEPTKAAHQKILL